MTTDERKNESRQVLLDAAKKLFIEKGYAAVSTREIAEAAGVNLGAIQYHFGSKAKLFIETVHALMEGGQCAKPPFTPQSEMRDEHEAAANLAKFVASFLCFLVRPVGPQPCRMLFREIFTETCDDKEMYEALVSSAVKDFIQPTDAVLRSIVKKLKPKATQEEIELSAQSIIGQCAFYFTHQPFVERLRGRSFCDSPNYEKVVAHVLTFTLRALGCDEKVVSGAVKSLAKISEEQV